MKAKAPTTLQEVLEVMRSDQGILDTYRQRFPAIVEELKDQVRQLTGKEGILLPDLRNRIRESGLPIRPRMITKILYELGYGPKQVSVVSMPLVRVLMWAKRDEKKGGRNA